MLVKTIQDLGNRMEAQTEKIQEMCNNDMEELKNKQGVMDSTLTGLKNTLEETNSGITEAEEWISELKDRMVEINAVEQNKGKRIKIKKEDSPRDPWVNINGTNAQITEVPEAEGEQEQGV